MNDISAGYAELPRTAYLDNALRRARTAAEQRSHRHVTLEHLLLALLDDPDSIRLLLAVGADVPAIQSGIADAVNHRMSSLVVPDGRAPTFSHKFDALMLSASEQAVRLGRRQVDGSVTIIAIAKDQESNASAILARNGFAANAALHHLSIVRGAPEKPQEPIAKASTPALPSNWINVAPSAETLRISPDASVDEMLQSVRSILDAEERKSVGASSPYGLSASPSASPNAPPRTEPRLNAYLNRDPEPRSAPAEAHVSPRLNGAHHPEPRSNPKAAPTAPQEPARSPPRGGATRNDVRRQAAVAANEHVASPPARREERGKPADARRSRGRPETPPILALLLEHIPRKMRVAVAETLEVQMTKDDAAALFDSLKARGAGGNGHAQITRAITVRLTAPEGGFFIETLSPETQWVFDRPSFLGGDEFGRWIWTLIPSDSGRHNLSLVLTARDIDDNGLAGDIAAPEQMIEIRVRGNRLRAIGRLLKTMLLLLLGSGLTVGIYYALKVTGKLPH